MNSIKKILVMAPVVATGCGYAYMHHFHQLQHTGNKRFIAFVIAAMLFYVWVAAGIIKRKNDTLASMIIQSSFYVYVFSVLTLTGYFVFFGQVSAHNWWHTMIERVHREDGVNLTALLFVKRHQYFSYDTVGNFFMLLPLGIYLPLLYKEIKGLLAVCVVAMLVSVSVELMQLATNVRIADIDDVILNTAGAAVGFIIFFIINAAFAKPADGGRQWQTNQ